MSHVAMAPPIGCARRVLFTAALLVTNLVNDLSAQIWPELPAENNVVELPAQEWPLRPGPRSIRVLVHYPRQQLSAETGLMLSLHNWGGVDCIGTAVPQTLADRWNLVVLCVNYLQSGPADSIQGPEPYDCGYLQSLDALRSLWWVRDRLLASKRSFDDGRIYATGGSGGGNVTLMSNKLAPRTFACVIDMCGMKKLSDDVAYDLPGGTTLNARWSRDSKHPYSLSPGHQELRFVGCLEHLWAMQRMQSLSKIIVVHGVEDDVCPFADAEEMVNLMRRFGIDVEPHFITKEDLDGVAFQSAGHSLGDRTEIVIRMADRYLRVNSPQALRRTSPTDFERREEIRYRTSDGEFIISYQNGYPVGRFEPKAVPGAYSDHQHLHVLNTVDGVSRSVTSTADWDQRRRQIRSQFESVAGALPSPNQRVPLEVQIHETTELGELTRLKLSYQSDLTDRVPAYLFIPKITPVKPRPAVLCLHQTFVGGKSEAAGLDGNPDLHYALELARRGYVTLAPDYPSLGEHAYEWKSDSPYASGSMKAIWDNIRAVDLLESRTEVNRHQIAVLGHSLGGHNAIFTALFDERLKVVVSSCGFSRFHKDDVPSWTGPRYFPAIATKYGNDPDQVPFDFPELVAAIAPRAFFASAAVKDNDFDVTGVRETLEFAKPIFALYRAEDRLRAYYPEAVHSFPPDAREAAYQFLDREIARDQEDPDAKPTK